MYRDLKEIMRKMSHQIETINRDENYKKEQNRDYRVESTIMK